MKRQELLTKLAMEIAEWPKTTRDAPANINAMWRFDHGSSLEESGVYVWATHYPGPEDDTINEHEWRAERERLINKPSWDSHRYQYIQQNRVGAWAGASSFHSPRWAHIDKGAIPAGHDWRETVEARPVKELDWAPDVGMECEIGASTQYLTIRYPEGSVVKIYARFTDDRGVELFAFVGKNPQVSGVATAKCFAPLGTAARREEDRVAEAMRPAILDAGNAVYSEINGSTADSIARTLYRAIKSGKLKLESQP